MPPARSAVRRVCAALALALVASLVLVVAPPPRPAAAQPASVPQQTWVTNGRVKTMITGNGRLYLAGYFTQVGPNTGHGGAVDRATGGRNPAFPKVDGDVYTAVADGAGGWYIGGSFSTVGSSFRKNAAQITANGAVTGWNPAVTGTVNALAYDPGSGQVFLGGDFTAVGGATRSRLAAVATGTGAVVTGWVPSANGVVRALALAGGAVLAGGDFTAMSGQTRGRLAALDGTSGAVTGWNPNAGGAVRTLAVSPDGTTVYLGGDFTFVAGGSRSRLAAVDASTGAARAWNPGAGAAVRTLAVAPDGTTVYAGGDFTSAGATTRAGLAAFGAATGAVTSWNPGVATCARATPEESPCITGVHTLEVSADGATVSAGGLFTSAGGVARNNLAAFAAATGAPTAWDPSPNATVRALSTAGTQTFVGGELTSLNAPTRNRIAALDAASGALDPGFRADAGDYVQALALSSDGTRLFLGGDFAKVNGKARTNVAAVDAVTGALDSTWNPGAKGGPVMALAVSGGRLYLGGKFASVAGVDVPRLAAVDPLTGAVVSGWRPAPDSWVAVLTLSPGGTLVYAGGDFGSIGGRTQWRLAAVRSDTGTVSPWAPYVTYPVLTLTLSPDGTRLYSGGAGYNTYGNKASAYNTSLNGSPVWQTWGDGNVQGLGLSPAGDVLYIGGHFAYQNGVPRQHIAAVRSSDGGILPFAPVVNSALGVWFLSMNAGTLFIGGDFTIVAGVLQQGFARFPGTGPSVTVNSGPTDGTSAAGTSVTYGGTATSPGGRVVQVEVSADGAPFDMAGVTCTGCGTGSATWTWSVPGPLSEAHHTFDIRAVDTDGAASTVEQNYTVDLTPPDIAVTGGPAEGGSGNDSTPTYTGTASDAGGVAGVQVSIDGAAFGSAGVSCSGCGTSTAAWTWTPPVALADDPHSFSFRTVDGAGLNSPTVGRTVSIDTAAPAFVALDGPSLVARFSEPLSCATVSRPDFTATVNGTASKVKTVTCTGALDDGIDIALGTALHSGDTVAVILKAPVNDPAGNAAPRPVTWSVVVA